MMDFDNNPDDRYLSQGMPQNQQMAQQYSGNYGQDAKHSLVGTIIGMVPGWGQAVQSMMSDGTGPASQYITGNAAQNAGQGGNVPGMAGGVGISDLLNQTGSSNGGASSAGSYGGISSLLANNGMDPNYMQHMSSMQNNPSAPSTQASYVANNYPTLMMS